MRLTALSAVLLLAFNVEYSFGFNHAIIAFPLIGRSFPKRATDWKLGVETNAMTEYMVKSHEEKLKAVKDVETKKNSEIQALKKEIEELKVGSSSGMVLQGSSSSSSTSALAATSNLSEGDMAAKLLSYQRFMADYIVKAQEQKLEAVQAAERSAEKKFQERLLLLSGDSSGSAVLANDPKTKLYEERTAAVSAAAKAGKSRWGKMESQKAEVVSRNTPTAPVASSTPPPPPPPPQIPVPPEVEAADHGLRSQGSVGGLTLAERVALGSSSSNGVPAPAVAAPPPVDTRLYDIRNAAISAAAKAGKQTRWGDQEVSRATELALLKPSAAAAAPAINGLRANGDVRVNLGAQILQS